MSEQGYPVTVEVRRPDGSVEQVRVGTAIKSGDGFVLRMGELQIGASPVAPAARPAAAYSPAPAYGGGGMVLPNYGRSKGMPIQGASMQDLEYYAAGCHRTLNDPAKSRWHEKERALLAAIEAEIARQQGGGGGESGGGYEPPPPGDDDIPF
ncbi:MAG TPA: hypothetical protein DFS52_03795 [Myxococcales bacterium]|jgi:hypothetical protein|nr:hypothetical protein [Myxococcales bacterium]